MRSDMDQLAIQTIEHFLDVPLIAPERIHEIDAKEIAAALGRLEEEVTEAREEVGDAWSKPIDETNVERLEEITELLREAIDNCETCNDDNPCARCSSFKQWLAEA
jgi:hypothetical protein